MAYFLIGFLVMMNKLRRTNFAPEEFFVSDTAERLGIVNYPPKDQEETILEALMTNADMMQEIRDILGFPIKINSAYRCPELNKAVGSKTTSDHPKGFATDFECPEFGTPEEIVKKLHEEGVIVDQCFNEGSWVHASRRFAKNRMMYGNYLLKNGKRAFKAL